MRQLPALLLLLAAALPLQAAPASGKGSTADCSRSPQPEQCAARQRAAEICKGKDGSKRRQCLEDSMPSVDCSKSRHPQRCEIMHKAQLACQDKFGPELRQCIQTHSEAARK